MATYVPNADQLTEPTGDKPVKSAAPEFRAAKAKLARALTVPEAGEYPELANAAARADKMLGFNSLGDPTVLVPASGSAADVLVQLANTSNAAQGDALVGVKYAQPVAAVALNLHSYIEDDGAYNVMGFIPEANKSAIRDFTSSVDHSTQIQAALSASYSDSRRGLAFPRGLFNISTGLSLTMSGSRLDNSLIIRGAGRYATKIQKLSGASAAFTITSPDPVTTLCESNLHIADLALYGEAKNSNGLALQGLAYASAARVQLVGFNTGLQLDSFLVGKFDDCYVFSNNSGIVTRNVGIAGCNMLTFAGGSVSYNKFAGLDLGGGSGIHVVGIDIERNGVARATVTISNASPAVVSWTSHGLTAGDLVQFTTTGSLPTGLSINTSYYVLPSGLTANAFQLAASPGGTAINTSSAGSGTHTGGMNTTGMMLRNTIDDEIGYGVVDIDSCWIELNLGYSLDQEACSGLILTVRDSEIIASEAGRAVRVKQARNFNLVQSLVVGSTSTVEVQSLVDKFHVEDCLVDVIVDSSAYPTYINTSTSTADFASGKISSFTATLTGCTTSPTGSVNYTKQGRHVTLNIPNISGTSNTTAATLTGLPAELWPVNNRSVIGICVDNGTEKLSQITVLTSGEIILNNALSATFTSSGTKGVSALTVSYEI